MKKKIIIQEEIAITPKDMEKAIKEYETMPDQFGLGIFSMCLDKEGIVNEIRKLSPVGKEILLMRYKYRRLIKNV